MLGISGIGLATSFIMKEIPMQEVTDDNWGVEQKQNAPPKDAEKAIPNE